MSEALPPIAVFASFSGTGGVEGMLVNLMRGFVEAGRDVNLLLVRADSPHLDRLPAAVRRTELGGGHTLLAAPALARWLRKHRPTALLAAKDRAGRTAVLARMLAGTDTRLVLRLGTNLSTAMAGHSALARQLRYLPIRLLYPRLDHIVAVSEGVAADTAAISGVPTERIGVIRNPVVTPEVASLAAAPCPHPWLAAPDGPPVIIGAGRLQRQKDFPTLLCAFAALRRERPCRLLILGEGGGRVGLETLGRELGLAIGSNGAVDLPGYQSNIHAFLSRAALFVLSSAWEGSPNVLTEALALGTPVVSTDCPSGPREILEDGRYGPLVPVGDVGALAAAMARTLDAPLPPQTLKEAVAEYTQAASAARYLAALDDAPPMSSPA